VLYAWYIYSSDSAASNRSCSVAKTISCADGGIVCNATVRGETDEDVIAKAAEHAREKHGVDVTQSKTLVNYVRTLIREDGS
jgi:predicted small metal-binding protein